MQPVFAGDTNTHTHTHTLTRPLLISLSQVLAHRGGHWTSLQTACAVLWNQACTLPMLLVPPPADCLGVEQVYSSLTPVLAVACELLMDMMDRLKVRAELLSELCGWSYTQSCGGGVTLR